MPKRVKENKGEDSASDYESQTKVPKKEKRPLNAWATALQEWNKANNNSHYVIPKKGTAEYNAVKSMMKS